eukprot:SAG31_NODE_30615_length_378_cov_1.283154_2_plen_39_part_01
MYAKKSSVFVLKDLPCTIRDPDSSFSIVWDVVQLFLLLY